MRDASGPRQTARPPTLLPSDISIVTSGGLSFVGLRMVTVTLPSHERTAAVISRLPRRFAAVRAWPMTVP